MSFHLSLDGDTLIVSLWAGGEPVGWMTLMQYVQLLGLRAGSTLLRERRVRQ